MTTAILSLKARFHFPLRLVVATVGLLACGLAASGEQTLIQPAQVAGPPSAEDLLVIPGSPWVLASAVSIGPEQEPGLYVLGNTPPHLEKVEPEVGGFEATTHCPVQLDKKGFSPLGMSLRTTPQGALELLVINRGTRKAIEVFAVDIRGRIPVLTWRDCITLPEQVFANSVATHPDGGLLVTQSYDPRDPDAWAKQQRGEKTGELYAWHADQGWSIIPGSFLSGPNGLVVADDGCFAIVAAWAERNLLRVALPCGGEDVVEPATASLVFMPDNLRWTDRGTVLATGQVTTPDKLLACVGENRFCPTQLVVAELDPDTMTLVSQWRLDARGTAGLGTTALQVGEEIWVSGIPGRVILRFTP